MFILSSTSQTVNINEIKLQRFIHSFIHFTSRKLFSVSLVSLLLTILVSCQCDNPIAPVNQKPIINDTNFHVSETIDDTEVIGQLQASDREGSVLIYSILTNDPNVFFELSSNGMLRLSNDQSLDYDMATNHRLVVEVSDGELSNQARVIIDVRSNQATVINDQSFTALETISDTEVIARIQAADPEKKKFVYNIVNNDLFEINLINGTLSLARGQFLDYEVKSNHQVTVEVNDGEFLSRANITIDVQDVTFMNGDTHCGDLRDMAPVIDGSEIPSFFQSGNGTSNVPYTIPVRSGCEELLFVFDPQYTNSPDLYFTFDVNDSYVNGPVYFESLAPEEFAGYQATSTFSDGTLNWLIQFDTTSTIGNFQISDGVITPKHIIHYTTTPAGMNHPWISKKAVWFYKPGVVITGNTCHETITEPRGEITCSMELSLSVNNYSVSSTSTLTFSSSDPRVTSSSSLTFREGNIATNAKGGDWNVPQIVEFTVTNSDLGTAEVTLYAHSLYFQLTTNTFEIGSFTLVDE